MTTSNCKTACKFKPLADRVLVQRLEAESKVAGIILPDSAKKKQETAKVLALGTGKRDDKGNVIPFAMKVGDVVLMDKYAGQEVTIDDETYVVLRADDIIAIVE